MTNRSESNLTEILDRFCRASVERQRDWAVEHGHSADAIKAWDDRTAIEKHEVKEELLPLMMAVLDVADEVDGIRPTRSQFIAIANAVRDMASEDLGMVGVLPEATKSIVDEILAVEPGLITFEELE